MRAIRLSALLLALGLAAAPALAQPPDEPSLDEHLAPFEPFLGKTYRGELSDSTPEHPKFDVTRWERALGGKAVRNQHSVGEGAYCGETIAFWDAATSSVIYYYFTTAGFYTHGSLRFEGAKYIANEKVTGAVEGITEVRSTGELLADGTLTISSEYLKGGQWVPGHAAVYHEDPNADARCP
jgi:hypothetical protein